MMVLLQAMQGLGAPGRSIWGTTMGAPSDTTVWVPSYGEVDGKMSSSTKAAKHIPVNPTRQRLWRLTVPDAILNPPVSWYGEGFCGRSLEQQFTHFEYPMEGYSEIKLWYRYGGSFMGTMSDTTKWVRMYQSPKLEFVVNQDIWYNSETRMADVILPGLHQFRARRHGRVGRGQRLHRARQQRVQLPGRGARAEMHRTSLGVQVGLRDLRADRGAAGSKGRIHRRQDRGRLGEGLLRHLRPAQRDYLGGVRPQGLPHHQHQGWLQSHAVVALVL